MDTPSAPHFEVHGVHFSLGNRVILDNVSFTAQPGEIIGILGPNGSGKSSLMRCMTGIWQAQQGTMTMAGTRLTAHNRALRAHMGVVFQEPSLDDRLTALENLQLGAALFGIARHEATTRAKELLAFMELNDRAHDVVRTFSGGMRRRLELARALIHQPTLLLLDEPTTGLDPYGFERTWQRLEGLRRQQQLTLILTTHRADEAERCDRLIILDQGKVLASASPRDMLAHMGASRVVIDTDSVDEFMLTATTALQITCERLGDQLMIDCDDGHAMVAQLIALFGEERLSAVTIRRPTLADAFLKLTGRTLVQNPDAQS